MWSVREQALYWTDNVGGCIYRLEPESGREQSFALGQNVMAIGLRKGAGSYSRSPSSSPSTSLEASLS